MEKKRREEEERRIKEEQDKKEAAEKEAAKKAADEKAAEEKAAKKAREKAEKEALEKLKEAPERCICSDLGIQRLYGKATRAAVLNCKCGEAQCVVNLEGGISCLKQGLFK